MSVIKIEGYASVFNVLDDQQDRVCPGAFQHTLDQPDYTPKMLWQHDVRTPVGRWIHLNEDARGLYVQGELFLDLPQGRDAWVLIHNKVLDGLSIGFHVQKARRCPKTGVRSLHQVHLIEISLVTFAAARPWTTIRHAAPIRDPTPQAHKPDALVHQLHILAQTLQSSSKKLLKR